MANRSRAAGSDLRMTVGVKDPDRVRSRADVGGGRRGQVDGFAHAHTGAFGRDRYRWWWRRRFSRCGGGKDAQGEERTEDAREQAIEDAARGGQHDDSSNQVSNVEYADRSFSYPTAVVKRP